MAFTNVGIDLEFSGKGKDEVGRCRKTGKTHVRIDPRYFRPTEVDFLIGNPAKAKELLGWQAQTPVEELCREMVLADLYRTKQEIEKSKGRSQPLEALIQTPGGFLGWLEKNHGVGD
jgi:GDPmannose 4,6-dehydratase